MSHRRQSVSCTVGIALACCLVTPSALAAGAEYKVATARLFELQGVIDKFSKEGWRVRSMSTSTQCVHTQPNGSQVKGECQVVILEREK